MSNQALEQAFADRIEKVFAAYMAGGKEIGDRILRHVNTARELGIVLKEWAGSEQVAFTFFQERQSKIPFDYEKAKQFVSISNRMPEKATNVNDVRHLMQMDLVAAGVLQIAERSEPQNASRTTPLTIFVNTIGSAKEKFKKWVDAEPVDQWPDDRRERVKEELSWLVELHGKL